MICNVPARRNVPVWEGQKMKAFAWLNSVKWLAILVVASLAVATVASADNGPNHKTRQGRPISLGTSGGNINHFEKAFCYGGTLGGLVQDR